MSLITDLSTITTIPVSTLEKLHDKQQLCILHKVSENEKKGEPITYVDIGYGTLYIKHENDELRYKFIPSKSFEKDLKEVILSGQSTLISKAEEALKDKITNTYKDLF